MEICRETGWNERLHLKVRATAEEIDEYLLWIPQAILAEGTAPSDLQGADTTTLCADSRLQGRIRGHLMEQLTPSVLKAEALTPVGQLIYLTKEAVVPGKDFNFIISVVPKPSVELSSYDAVHAYPEELVVTDEEVEHELHELAKKHACLLAKDSEGKIEPDNFVEITTEAIRSGEPYEQLTARKRLYKLGEQFLPADFDRNLMGMKTGECKSFSLTFVDGSDPIEISVSILGIYEETVSEPDDAWVERHYPGIGGLDMLKEKIKNELLEKKRPQYEKARADFLLTQLARRVISPIPEKVFEVSFAETYRSFSRNIMQNQGLTVEEYFYKQGTTERQVKEEMALDIRRSLPQGFALDSYAAHYCITAHEDDYQQVLSSIAPGDEAATRNEYEVNGREYLLDEAALRQAALEHLLENCLPHKA